MWACQKFWHIFCDDSKIMQIFGKIVCHGCWTFGAAIFYHLENSQGVKRRASLIGNDYYQPKPEPGSSPEEYYQVVPFRAKVGLSYG